MGHITVWSITMAQTDIVTHEYFIPFLNKTIVNSAMTINRRLLRLLRHLRREENARIQEWVVLHAKNRFASNVGVKDTITSTIIQNLLFICRYILLSTLAFRKNSNDKLRFKYDS